MNIGTLTILLGVTTSGVNKAIRDVGRLERTVAGSVANINAQLLAFSRTMLSFVTFPTVVLGAVGTNAFSKFEYNLHKITGLIGVAENQTKQWGKEILNLAPKFGASATKMSDALYFITSANPYRAASEQMEILKASTKAAEAGLGDIKTVADTVTSVLNAYGSENISAAQAVDSLIYGVREGKVEAEDFAKVIGKILPISSKLGMSFQEVAAAAAMLGRTGTNAAEAATQVRRLLVTLVQQPEKGQKALSELNSSYNDLINTLRSKGLLSLMMQIKNMAEFKGEDFLAEIFPNIRAMLPVMDILGENWEENIGIMERSKEITGELDKLWGSYTKTMKYAVQQAFSMAGVTMIEFGNQIKGVVIPILALLVKALSNLINWFTGLSSETKETITKITLLAAAFGPLYIAASSIISVLVSVIKVALLPLRLAFMVVAGAVKILVNGLQGLKAVMIALKSAVLANPYVLLAGSLIAVAYAFAKVKDTSYAWVMFLDAAFKRIHIWFLQFKVWIYKHLEKPLLNAVKFLNSLLPEKWAMGTEWDFSDEIEGNIETIARLEEEIAKNPYSKFSAAAKETWNDVKDDFSGLTSWITKKWDSLWGSLGMKDLSFGGGFGPTEELPVKSIEEFMAEVTKGSVLINDYIYNPFEKVDGLIQDTWGDLALLETHARRAGSTFDDMDETMRLIHNRIKEINQEMILTGSTEKQIEQIKKLNSVFNDAKVTVILRDMNDQLAEADRKTGLFGKTWEELNLQADIYNDTLRRLLAIDTSLFDEKGLEAYRNAVLNVAGALRKLNEEEERRRAIIDLTQRSLQVLGDLYNAFTTKRIQDLENEKEAELNKVGENAVARQKIEEEFAEKRKKLLIKQALFEKALTVASIALSTAEAVMKYAKSPVTAPLVPWVIALGAAQSAAAVATPIPQMANGGIVPAGYPNDSYPAMLTSGEAVVPPHKLPDFERQPVEVKVTVEGKTKGKDLYYIVKEMERVYQNSY